MARVRAYALSPVGAAAGVVGGAHVSPGGLRGLADDGEPEPGAGQAAEKVAGWIRHLAAYQRAIELNSIPVLLGGLLLMAGARWGRSSR